MDRGQRDVLLDAAKRVLGVVVAPFESSLLTIKVGTAVVGSCWRPNDVLADLIVALVLDAHTPVVLSRLV